MKRTSEHICSRSLPLSSCNDLVFQCKYLYFSKCYFLYSHSFSAFTCPGKYTEPVGWEKPPSLTLAVCTKVLHTSTDASLLPGNLSPNYVKISLASWYLQPLTCFCIPSAFLSSENERPEVESLLLQQKL